MLFIRILLNVGDQRPVDLDHIRHVFEQIGYVGIADTVIIHRVMNAENTITVPQLQELFLGCFVGLRHFHHNAVDHPEQPGFDLVLFLFGLTISSIGTTVSLYMPDFDTYSAFSSMITMPLYFASTSLVSFDDMPGILQAIATVNPLTYAIDSIRDIADGTFPGLQIGVLLCIFTVILTLCIRNFRIVTIK
jgi:ABC-type polysaccharide/polyol phosphate export permease